MKTSSDVQGQEQKHFWVIREDFDTRILKTSDEVDDEYVFGSWEEAREEALVYLQEVIDGCSIAFNSLLDVATYEDYQWQQRCSDSAQKLIV